MKLLSVVVPSYNMQDYLSSCLDSLINIPANLLSGLEVIVVNDGSSDNTSEIAHCYRQRYPDNIIVIDKANGHYGSCINAALKVAKGKYFRILDADDWFDSESLQQILSILGVIDSDVVYTHRSVHYEVDEIIETETCDGMVYDKVLLLDEYTLPTESLKMHCLMYRTELLRSIGYRQTEGICYSDNEYVVIPLQYAQTLYAIDLSLYQYRIGRAEQSVSLNSIIKNTNQYITILERLISIDATESKRFTTYASPIISRLLNICSSIFLMHCKPDADQSDRLYSIFNRVDQIEPSIINNILNSKIKKLPLYKIWHSHPQFYYNYIFPLLRLYINR